MDRRKSVQNFGEETVRMRPYGNPRQAWINNTKIGIGRMEEMHNGNTL
jgi:hypothetical protein